MNKIIIHHRSSHHAVNSGYGRLIDYMDAHVIYGKAAIPYRLAKRIASFKKQKGGIYNSDSVFKETELFLYLWKRRKEHNIVHFLNGERDIRHIKFFKKFFPNTKFIASFHKPPAVLSDTIQDTRSLKQLDGAICVGANQVEFLKNWLNLDKVQYIPHGVDTEFFVPDPHRRQENLILFVGQHMRDFETFNKVISQLLETHKELEVVAILHSDFAHKILRHPQVNVKSGVNDEELRNLYQQATVLFLPLLDSTACNSLLEAMACGLPIVTTDVGGNREYLKNVQAVLCDVHDFDAQFFNVQLLLTKSELKTSKKINHLKNLSWTSVSRNIHEFYNFL